MELAPLPTSLLLFFALVLAIGGMRVFELTVSKRRQRQLRARGVAKVNERYFAAMVALHTSVLVGAGLEAWLFRRSPVLWVTVLALLVLLAATGLRLWVIATLGPHWNVQIMDSAPLGVVTDGPFRFVRHPNYVAVFLELAALPLVHGAWITAAAGTLLHLWVLQQRIRAEETVLLAHAPYRELMGHKPRFLPRLRPLSSR